MALGDRRLACEKVLQQSSDNVSYRHFIECGYVKTKVIDEITREPFGIYVLSAAPGYGKTATAKILEAECINSGRCIPVYVQLNVSSTINVREFLLKEFKRMFAERGSELLTYRAGDYVNKIRESDELFLKVFGMMYCSGMCGDVPRALLIIDELTAPFAAGSVPKKEELERALTTLDNFLRDVQIPYCNPISGIVLMGHWHHDTLAQMRISLSSTAFGGLDRVRFGDIKIRTEEYFTPLGDSARRFAEGVLRAYGLEPSLLVLDAYASLADAIPLRKANRLLYWLTRDLQPSSDALKKLSHLIEDELATLLGGRARVRTPEGERDVQLPGGRCVEVKVRSRLDRAEGERIISEYRTRGCTVVVVSSDCGGAPQCIEVKMLDKLATVLLSQNMLEVDPLQYGAFVEKTAKIVAKKVAEMATSFVKVEPQEDCKYLLLLFEEDCKLLNRKSRSKWKAKSKLLRFLNGEPPNDVGDVEAIIKKNRERLERCGVRLDIVETYIICRWLRS